MKSTLTPFFPLLLSTAILLMGNGLQGTLIPVRGDIETFSDTMLGIIGAAYFAGFLLGCLQSARIVQRAGHIRAFAVFASLASISPLLHALFLDELLWILLRALTGYCFAGLYMVIESWINEQASNEIRGRLFGFYLLVNLASLTIGQLLLNLAPPQSISLFALASILGSLALLPVSLTGSIQPAPIEKIRIDLKGLWQMSPIGLLGCFAIGLTNAPFWSLAPIFARNAGFDIRGISFFMTAAIIGGAVAQWPIGRLSDMVDRRWVMIGVCIGAAFGEIALAFAPGRVGSSGLLAIAFVFGAFTLTLYSLCIAHTNDVVKKGDFVSVSGGLLLIYSFGAIIGPVIASSAMPYLGDRVIFVFTAIVHVIFAGFVLFRIFRVAAIPPEKRPNFVSVPISRMAPEPVELDPRANTEQHS
ncbi:MAG: MFS transporter [SAR324 cluster bacterium]|nr:MFS transporter [SAR324 cluster bacterium]